MRAKLIKQQPGYLQLAEKKQPGLSDKVLDITRNH